MEMDGATLSIGIIALMLFALPFVLDLRSRRKRTARLLDTLRKAAAAQGYRIAHVDTSNGIALGLDEGRNTLFFHNEREEGSGVQQVDLATVRACQVMRDGRTHRTASTDGLPDRLELGLLPKDKGRSETRLVLYRATYGTVLNGEVQLAEAWTARINDRSQLVR